MTNILNIIGWILLLTGLLVIFIGTVGLWRLPSFFTKIHAAGLIDSFGLPITLLGLAFLQDNSVASCKLIFMILIVFILNPTSSHALSLLAYKKTKEDYNKSHE